MSQTQPWPAFAAQVPRAERFDQMAPQERDRGPISDAVRANVAALRAQHGWSVATLAEKLAEAGWAIAPIGLRRIEAGERRVTVDDLLALSLVYNVAPMDLLVSKEAGDGDPYDVTSTVTVTAGQARRFIRGDWPLLAGVSNSTPGASATMAEFVDQLPAERKDVVWQEWLAQLREEKES